ncbi:hypothetical protein K437DRAFT_256987 [Tilletiaria anomala UBC 951]|uniref:RING-type domain-containing protein n=1 Tax=Tilletiaria anomala (strain ATCC 24038 / CBS 436.72 / UBC 951) TaxID=1037660 RepID=A0A066W184_TILAU|nr:uncharacterized protein K437DRAFT_256987 [Tilletiaria anomala UBC 951]KDN44555.1 hypothetical protein K437DRAFT_256987 [Tilletiaria anomala UBC 951]
MADSTQGEDSIEGRSLLSASSHESTGASESVIRDPNADDAAPTGGKHGVAGTVASSGVTETVNGAGPISFARVGQLLHDTHVSISGQNVAATDLGSDAEDFDAPITLAADPRSPPAGVFSTLPSARELLLTPSTSSPSIVVSESDAPQEQVERGSRRSSMADSESPAAQTRGSSSEGLQLEPSHVTKLPQKLLPPLVADYACPICFEAPRNAVATPCGHVLCGECLFQVAKTEAEKAAAEARSRRAAFMPGSFGDISYATLLRQMEPVTARIRRVLAETGIQPLPSATADRMAALLAGDMTALGDAEEAWLAAARAHGVHLRMQQSAPAEQGPFHHFRALMGILRSQFGSAGPGIDGSGSSGGANGGLEANRANVGDSSSSADAPAQVSSSLTRQPGTRRISVEDLDPMRHACPVCRTPISGGFFGGLKKKAVQGLRFKHGKPSDTLELRYGKEYADAMRPSTLATASNGPRAPGALLEGKSKGKGKKRQLTSSEMDAKRAAQALHGGKPAIIDLAGDSSIESGESIAPAYKRRRCGTRGSRIRAGEDVNGSGSPNASSRSRIITTATAAKKGGSREDAIIVT